MELFFGAMALIGMLMFCFTVLCLAVLGIVKLWRALFGKPAAGQSRTSINYIPRLDRVIVSRLPLPEQDPNQVFVPQSQQKPLNEGHVIAFGKDVEDIELGAVVCFLDFAGTPITVDGQDYLSMRESEVHGVRP